MEIKRPKEQVKVSGSAAAIPLVKLLAQEFERYHPGMKIAFLPETHSRGGLAGAREGELDIGLLSRGLTEDEAKYNLQYLHLAQDGIVFTTHKTVKIRNITSQQLRNIYSGKITNWRQLGGRDEEITVLDRPEHTSPKITLRRKLFGKDLEIVKSATVLERPSQMNESLRVMPYSIGYTSLGEVISSEFDVNVLNVDGIPPAPAQVEKMCTHFLDLSGWSSILLPTRGS